MNPLYNEPLTDEEQRFAEDNYGLIPFYLKQYNAYDDDLAYNSIMTGYMKAIKKYFSKEELRQYNFSTICKWNIVSCLGSLWRSQRRKSKHLQQTDLIYFDFDDELNIYENIPDECDPFETVYYNDYFDKIANILSDEEKQLITYLLDFYTQEQIGQKMNCSQRSIGRKVKKIREKITERGVICQT